MSSKYEDLADKMRNFETMARNLKNGHKSEMDEFVRTHNAKYNKLLQEKLDLEDLLKKEKGNSEKLRNEMSKMK